MGKLGGFANQNNGLSFKYIFFARDLRYSTASLPC